MARRRDLIKHLEEKMIEKKQRCVNIEQAMEPSALESVSTQSVETLAVDEVEAPERSPNGTARAQ